jgi:nucleotide-binding universal stress UspA family protein
VKILATFDESLFSEAIIPQLEELARLPDVEIVLLSLVETPLVASDAVDAALAELSRYLDGIVQRLPKGPRYRTITAVTMFPAASIIEHALDEQPDVIVMANARTHRLSACAVRFRDRSSGQSVDRTGAARSPIAGARLDLMRRLYCHQRSL